MKVYIQQECLNLHLANNTVEIDVAKMQKEEHDVDYDKSLDEEKDV